jgi:tetratricopeptide (TPR) repeat protein
VGRYNQEALKRVLADLGEGIEINQALSRHTEPIKKLDEDFASWFKKQAEEFASEIDLERPEFPPDADAAAIAAFNKAHPKNFWGLVSEGEALVGDRKWKAAKSPLEEAARLFPDYEGSDGPYPLLAVVHRELRETDAERAVLEKLAALDADATDARLRLMELAAQNEQWKVAADHAAAALAINPLIPAPHRGLAKAAEATGDRATAIDANRALLLLSPLESAEIHFRLAKLLQKEGNQAEARRHVLEALEQAPRFLAAHRLLLELAGPMDHAQIETEPAAPPKADAAAQSKE